METNENLYELPQPEDIPVREKEDAMGAYLMMFAAIGAGLPLPIINLIAVIIYYYLNRDKSNFVKFHTLQSLWSQIPVTLLNAVGVIWLARSWFLHTSISDELKGFIVMLILLNLVYFTFSMIAAVKARKGRMYYFWFFGQMAFQTAFTKNEAVESKPVNLPPQ